MKLLNLNAGIKISNTEHVIALLKDQNADFITLQELGRPREPGVYEQYRSQPEIEEALKVNYPFTFFGPQWYASAFASAGQIDRYFGGHIEQGSQIFSKWPIKSATNEFYHRHYEYMLDWSHWKEEDHGRALQVVEFVVNGDPLQVLNLHGIWNKSRQGDSRTLAQCQYIVEAARRKDIPTIIAGDFNLSPESESIQYLNGYFRNLVTEHNIASTRPTTVKFGQSSRVVDYLFLNGQVTVDNFYAIETDISDHLPLVLEFQVE